MNRKKLFIEILVFILITAAAVIGYNVTAAVSNEMISEGLGYPSGYPYINLSDLINDYDLFCSGHDIALPGASATTVTSGRYSRAIPLPSEDEVAFSTGVTYSSRNPYSATTSKTYGKYTSSGVVNALPEEAYVLAEMTENTNGNTGTFYNVTNRKYEGEINQAYAIPLQNEDTYLYGVNIDSNGQPQAYALKQEDDYYYVDVKNVGSDYFPYTYVQQAWWSTPAGSKGTAVTQNSFSTEAKAFQSYIDSVRKGTETVDRTVTVNGETVTVPAPVIDFQATGMISNAQVRYDADNKKYLIGPFSIDFPEWVTNSEERGEMRFSGISNMTLKGVRVNGNTATEITIDNSKWSIVYASLREENGATAAYPHDGEEFYISLDYMEDVTKISDIKVDFKYMNAGATYENLKGTYNIVSWTPRTEVVSNGEFPTYIHTLECSGIDSRTSQPFSLGLKAARWFEDASLSLFSGTLRTPLIDEGSNPTPLPPEPDDEPEEPWEPYEPDKPDEPDTPRRKKVIELTIPMAGEVWIDTPADKATNTTEGKRDDGEKGYKNAEVYVYKVTKKNGTESSRELAKVYNEDGDKEISFPIYTDENGNYSIPKILVPGSEKKNDDEIAYDVVFKYDGQTYEASKPLPTANGDSATYINATRTEKDEKYAKDSLASENATERNEFNKKFETISGGNAMDDNGNTVGNAGDLTLNYTSKDVTLDDKSKKKSTLTTLDSDGKILEQYKLSASTANTGILFPVNHKITKDDADEVIDTVTKEGRTTTTKYHTIYKYMYHINLAVKERSESDLGVNKDLYKAKLVVNEKEITKKYNSLIDFEDEKYAEFLNVQLQNAKTVSYKLPLYSSDYEYRATVYNTEADQVKAIKQGDKGNVTDLRVFLTYKISVFNEGSYDMVVNDLNDYYDKSFTLVTENQTANILDGGTRTAKVVAEPSYYRVVGANETVSYDYTSNGMTEFKWNTSEEVANDSYKQGSITAFDGLKLHPGEQLQLFITYEVDKDGTLNPTRNLLGEKNNVAEIARYSIYNLDGSVAGKIDRDSAPNNIRLDKVTDKAWYEDDTESAPAIKIEITNYINREINGVVWEDNESETIEYDQKVGNGILDNDEDRIPDIDVQLVEKINIDGIEYEKIWTNADIEKYFIGANMSDYQLDVTTDNDGLYTFKGVVAGNYVVRFKYGNKDDAPISTFTSKSMKYNGHDYKNTAYQAGMTDLNQEFHNLKSTEAVNQTRVSDARDYELQRMKVIAYSRDLINNELGTKLERLDNAYSTNSYDEVINNTQMVANTAKLNLEIDPVDYIENKMDDGTVEYKYIVNNIDFGLEQRSETKLDLTKKISKVTLYKRDGHDVVLEAYINEDGTYDVTKSTQYDKLVNIPETSNTQGVRFANIDKDYLSSLGINIEYTIKVTNNSEVDWTGELANFTNGSDIINKVNELEGSEAYKSGKITYGTYVGNNYYTNKFNSSDKIVKTNISGVIDYIDNNIAIDKDENNQVGEHAWKAVTVEELKNGKVLADSVYDSNGDIVDYRGNAFAKGTKANIVVSDDVTYNKSIYQELVPVSASGMGQSFGEIKVSTSTVTNSESSANNLHFNNMAEILGYTNTVGRRDMNAVPGNAQIALGAYTAATGYKDGSLVDTYEGAKEVTVNGTVKHLNGERDTAAADELTFTPPTGVDAQEEAKTNYMMIAFVAAIVLAGGIVVIKKFVVDRK